MTKQFQANTIPSLIDTLTHTSNVRLLKTETLRIFSEGRKTTRLKKSNKEALKGAASILKR